MADRTFKVIYHKEFVKHFKQRISRDPQLVSKYKARYRLFVGDRQHALLKDHRLTGDLLGKRSFRIGGDIRVVYRETEPGKVEFMDIGTHNQVYG